MDKGLQMNWLQRIQAAHRYKTSKEKLILHKCKLFYYCTYNIGKKNDYCIFFIDNCR